MGKQNEQYSRSFISAESSNSQSPSIDQTRLRESLVPLGPPLDLSKFREAIAPLFENITILSRTNERTSQMTDMFRRISVIASLSPVPSRGLKHSTNLSLCFSDFVCSRSFLCTFCTHVNRRATPVFCLCTCPCGRS